MLKTKEDIKAWLDSHEIENYTINDNLVVDVNDSVKLRDRNLTSIPVQFGEVSGFFDCSTNKLTSLKGSPVKVGSYIDCSDNDLTNLEECPKSVGGTFLCQRNPIKDLSSFSCEFSLKFWHVGKPIPYFEPFYENRVNNIDYSILNIKCDEMMKVISAINLMKELSHVSSNENTAKKPKI